MGCKLLVLEVVGVNDYYSVLYIQRKWNSFLNKNVTKMIVYLPSNVEEFRSQVLNLIDNISHLKAKWSRRLIVRISGQKKKKEKKKWVRAKNIGMTINYIIAWFIFKCVERRFVTQNTSKKNAKDNVCGYHMVLNCYSSK
jgi:hypothetical protein